MIGTARVRSAENKGIADQTRCIIGYALVAFMLEMVLGEPERVEPQRIHLLGDGVRGTANQRAQCTSSRLDRDHPR